MKKIFKIAIVCIMCGLLSYSVIGGNFSTGSSVKNSNKVYATVNDTGVIGTKNLNNTAENSATVGKALDAPEKGWKRYEDNDSKIVYKGSGWLRNNGNDTITQSIDNASIQIKFYGTKLRVLGYCWSNKYSLHINIDGVDYGDYTSSSGTASNTLLYEKKGMTLQNHVLIITPVKPDAGKTDFGIDAIDIDDSGYLIDPSTNPITELTLNKTTSTLKVGETDTLVATVKPDDATTKTVKWTSSDESVATVDQNGKVTAVKAGTATITAATTDGTNLTATCKVTVTEPIKGRAILEVVMSDSERKEYDLEMTEVNKFVDWYNGKTSPSYQIKITNNVKPFSNITEYLAHDKIKSFKVKEYTETN